MKKTLISILLVALLLIPITAMACGESESEKNPIAIMETSMGTIKFEIYNDKVPQTAANFINLASNGFFDGLTFHRVVNDFVIQTGDPTGIGYGGSDTTIPLEINTELKHENGAVGMARSMDPDSATSQFYICDGAQHGLDGNYAVFGQVIDGMDVVHAIAAVPVDSNSKPLADVIVTQITIAE
jgi:peptidyl-prolyl cis-trans isomerase B (cyclophilin B)